MARPRKYPPGAAPGATARSAAARAARAARGGRLLQVWLDAPDAALLAAFRAGAGLPSDQAALVCALRAATAPDGGLPPERK